MRADLGDGSAAEIEIGPVRHRPVEPRVLVVVGQFVDRVAVRRIVEDLAGGLGDVGRMLKRRQRGDPLEGVLEGVIGKVGMAAVPWERLSTAT